MSKKTVVEERVSHRTRSVNRASMIDMAHLLKIIKTLVAVAIIDHDVWLKFQWNLLPKIMFTRNVCIA